MKREGRWMKASFDIASNRSVGSSLTLSAQGRGPEKSMSIIKLAAGF